MSEIDELILTLRQLSESNNPLYQVIKNPALLFEGLNELKNMIEMKELKITIVEQIKLLITNKARNGVKESNEHQMNHVCISGDPGCGKTTIAKILAKIWISLDMIKKPTKKIDPTYTEFLEKEIIKYDYQLNQLNKGLEQQQEFMLKIRMDVNHIKHYGKKNYSKLLSDIRDAKYNLDKLLIKTDIKEPEEEVKFTVATRVDLVAGFLGQSAIKTRNVLNSACGGVLLLDEAYSLYNSDRDSFGEESLTVINEFMSLKSDQLIIIFAGYKDLMFDSIFKVQPGLSRRVQWFFDIPKYSPDALACIYKKQLEQHGWTLDQTINIKELFYKNKLLLKSPGDTEKLTAQSKIAYAEYYFNNTLKNLPHDSIITYNMIIKAMDKIKKNSPDHKNTIPSHMYL